MTAVNRRLPARLLLAVVVGVALFVLGGMVLNWMIFSGGEITNDPPSTITQPG